MSDDEKKECKYCERGDGNRPVINLKYVMAHIEGSHLSVDWYDTCMAESFVKPVEINFCPVCGRKLKN